MKRKVRERLWKVEEGHLMGGFKGEKEKERNSEMEAQREADRKKGGKERNEGGNEENLIRKDREIYEKRTFLRRI